MDAWLKSCAKELYTGALDIYSCASYFYLLWIYVFVLFHTVNPIQFWVFLCVNPFEKCVKPIKEVQHICKMTPLLYWEGDDEDQMDPSFITRVLAIKKNWKMFKLYFICFVNKHTEPPLLMIIIDQASSSIINCVVYPSQDRCVSVCVCLCWKR